jgi:hypothetical protein
MKKLILVVVVALSGLCKLEAQTMSVTLQYRPGPDSFYVYMVPSFNQAIFNLGPSQLTIVFSTDYPIASPPASAIATSSTITGLTWTAQDFALEAAPPFKKYVAFQTTGAPIPGGLAFNSPILIFRFQLNGGANCVGLLRNYVNGFDLTDPTGTAGGDFSAVLTDGNTTMEYFTTNSNINLQACSELILPVNILDFNVTRSNDDARIEWSVTGEDNKTSHYKLERSFDGTNFSEFATIPARKLPGTQTYIYKDLNIVSFNASKVFYRMKQYDIDAKFIQTSIRMLRLDIRGSGITVFPNPVREGFYVNIPFTDPDQRPVKLILRSGSGQLVQSKTITTSQASNYYFDIKDLNLASGQYYLQIYFEGQVLENKKLFVNKD